MKLKFCFSFRIRIQVCCW